MESIQLDFEGLNRRLERMNPAEILSWILYDKFRDKRVAATSSFQSQSLFLLYLIGKICPGLRVYFLIRDIIAFKQTHEYVELLQKTARPECGFDSSRNFGFR